MKTYVVDNYDTGELRVYSSSEGAARYVRNYYREHMTQWYGDYDTAKALDNIKNDLENVFLDYPYIEGVMFIREADLY